jgi:peptide chain release factor 1
MLQKLDGIEQRYQEVSQALLEVGDDYQRAAELNKERIDLLPLVEKAQAYRQSIRRLDDAHSLLSGEDDELRQLAETEIAELGPQIEQFEKEIKLMLLPTDPRDQRNVIMEIRAGTGGDEAALFAADLLRIYTRYAERRKWDVEMLSSSEIGIGGIKEVILMIKGRGAFSRLKYESGRIHTSTATVAVLAEVDDVEINIPDSDIRIDVYKSAGAGGQNVQKNSTAVRMTHLPTGIVVACQDERSQLQNRIRAMSILRARLYEIESEKQRKEVDSDRRSQVGTGERSEKIRTYNFPQTRVTDHRINVSAYNLSGILDGDIDQFIDELSTRDEADRLSAIGENG